MAQQNNGQLGDWATKCANAKPIEVSKKVACLELFKQGMGFRKAAKSLGLRPYTVRDWQRRWNGSCVRQIPRRYQAISLRKRRSNGWRRRTFC